MKVVISGAKNLPDGVKSSVLREALQAIAGYMGVPGTVRVAIMRGSNSEHSLAHVDASTITLYPRDIEAETGKDDPRFDLVRQWAWTLAHEMVHVRQNKLRADLPMLLYEAEAESLEHVFGPIVENYLRGVTE